MKYNYTNMNLRPGILEVLHAGSHYKKHANTLTEQRHINSHHTEKKNYIRISSTETQHQAGHPEIHALLPTTRNSHSLVSNSSLLLLCPRLVNNYFA